jgi:hypothetical protein
MTKTRIDTAVIRHGFTLFIIHISVSSVLSVAKKLCGLNKVSRIINGWNFGNYYRVQ